MPLEAPHIQSANTLPSPFPPLWACAFGDDRYGLWADLAIPDGEQMLVQRMRWIEPGSFLMGSPESEAERDPDEGPQHLVNISAGFWLADTTCTQAFWQALMADNPSHFSASNKGSPNHPVEHVSWHMIQAFLPKLEKLLPACQATLPTEAEWEYACRAGTATPFSFGATISTEQANFDGDYPYADTPKGEFRVQTVAVKALPANAWGLYQMHGNVWQWCADELRQYEEGEVLDPGVQAALAVDPASRAARGLRGGGWRGQARHARSAYRLRDRPDGRDGGIGFRFALRSRSQASGV